MKEPKYTPGLWIAFKMGDSKGAFGQINGGALDDDGGWLYIVDNAANPGSTYAVAEPDITATSDGSSWTKL